MIEQPGSARATLCMLVMLVGCGSTPNRPAQPAAPKTTEIDPDGPHHGAIETQLAPYVDGHLVAGIVIGVSDAGTREVYGFGTGPGKKPPNGTTLFDIGTATDIYTGLLLAESVQRREVDLDAPIADLLPPGVTVPTKDGVAITAKHLVLHSSGLPPYPPSLVSRKPPPDPFAGYTADILYQDLVATQLATAPGTEILTSDYGVGLLGFALGRKIGGGYSAALSKRVLEPLGLRDTVITLPAGAARRKALGTDDDLHPTSRWTWGALVGAGGVMTTADDALTLLEDEIDAAAGGRGPLRPQMRLTQEPQLDRAGDNEGLGWNIDSRGRLWAGGRTAGYRAYFGIDPKTKRAVVVLASTSTTLIDFIGPILFDVLDGTAKPPTPSPTRNQIRTYLGRYNFSGTVLSVVRDKDRVYLEGPGEPRHRMAPYGDRGFWIEDLQSAAKFVVDDRNQVRAMLFKVGGKTLTAPRLPDGVDAKPEETPASSP